MMNKLISAQKLTCAGNLRPPASACHCMVSGLSVRTEFSMRIRGPCVFGIGQLSPSILRGLCLDETKGCGLGWL